MCVFYKFSIVIRVIDWSNFYIIRGYILVGYDYFFPMKYYVVRQKPRGILMILPIDLQNYEGPIQNFVPDHDNLLGFLSVARQIVPCNYKSWALF